jgi:Mg-chelatase subunit ChlD
MIDPVCDKDGNTYERRAIEEWLEQHHTSPITRRPMEKSDLVPNRSLADAISVFQGKPPTRQPPIEKLKCHSAAEESLTLLASAGKFGTVCPVEVSIKSFSSDDNTYLNLCCVLDVSGSMDTSANFKNASGESEDYGLTLLDLVKHAVKTIIESLTPHDRLAIVAFDSDVRVVLGLTNMDQDGKKMAISGLDLLRPGSATNLWGGLKTGLDLLKDDSEIAQDIQRQSVLSIFTDGEPNIEPPRGYIPTLLSYKDKCKDSKLCSVINTFGFGYNINVDLLKAYATIGSGTYGFIPDAGLLGTVFIHSCANWKRLMSTNMMLLVEPMNGAELADDPVPGAFAFTKTDWGAAVEIGSVQYGQDRNIVINFKKMPDNNLAYAKIHLESSGVAASKVRVSLEATARCNEDLFMSFKLQALSQIQNCIELMNTNRLERPALVEQCIKFVQEVSSSISADSRYDSFKKDILGQVSEAFLPVYFDQWGRLYLPSLINAHQYQQCNNFKDFGVQVYGDEVFRRLRDEIEDLFNNLPPPKPSNTVRHNSSRSHNTYTSYSMSAFNNMSNPCYYPKCCVSTINGIKTVDMISAGDYIESSSKIYTKVLCVVRTLISVGKCVFVTIGDLKITSWHPVRIEGEWIFPANVLGGVTQILDCDYVYSFVLESNHTAIVSGVETVTLGHGFTMSPVVSHPYFGSQIIQDLKEIDHGIPWNSGLIDLLGCRKGPRGVYGIIPLKQSLARMSCSRKVDMGPAIKS